MVFGDHLKENADSTMVSKGRLLKNADTTIVFGDRLNENAWFFNRGPWRHSRHCANQWPLEHVADTQSYDCTTVIIRSKGDALVHLT